MKEKTAADLLMAIGEDMSAEEMMLLSLQGMIAAEVEMKRTELGMNQKQFAQYMGVHTGAPSPNGNPVTPTLRSPRWYTSLRSWG